VRIFSADGEDVLRINQRQPAKDDGLWHTLGNYRFEQGGQAFVIVSNEESDGHVVADAIQFLSEEQQNDAVSPPSVSSVAENDSEAEREARSLQLKALEAEIKAIRAKLDARPLVLSNRTSKPADLPIHVRGSVHQLGAVVPRGFLSCLPLTSTFSPIGAEDNGRLELANWLASDENPLTARVYVNRVWFWLMGEGLVRTIDNFGTTGESPSNPELLDWLTHRFIANGWSTKWLVREIVCSNAYKRSSRVSAEQMSIDPDNRLFARGCVRRLDAESIRDSLLRISGELDMPDTVESLIPEGVKEDYAFRHKATVRSVYGPWFRNSLPALYPEFDGANPSFSISKRSRSTIAQQSLALLNSDWVMKRCEKAAENLVRSDSSRSEEKIEHCFQAILNRRPTPEERQWAMSQLNEHREADMRFYQELAHALVASIDFRFIE
jgi:hypothetical protein